jgi:integrase
MTAISKYTPNAIVTATAGAGISFDRLQAMAEKTVSKSSARVYSHTWKLWQAWCADNGYDPLDFTGDAVYEFLAAGDTTKATMHNRVSALRAIAQILAMIDGDRAKFNYELLKKFKNYPTPTTAATNKERAKVAMTPAQAHRVLHVWYEDLQGDVFDKLAETRNTALIATLAYTAMRRAELGELRWNDINLETGVIHIRHGKGDKSRDVSIVGDFAIEALSRWQRLQAARSGQRDIVFCAVLKGDKLGADQPMNLRAINQIIDATGDRANVALTPHMFRRTWITEWLATGGSLRDAQMQAGHSNESTTLLYAVAGNAENRRREARFRF